MMFIIVRVKNVSSPSLDKKKVVDNPTLSDQKPSDLGRRAFEIFSVLFEQFLEFRSCFWSQITVTGSCRRSRTNDFIFALEFLN